MAGGYDQLHIVTESVFQAGAQTGQHAEAVGGAVARLNQRFTTGAGSWQGPGGNANQVTQGDWARGTHAHVVEHQALQGRNFTYAGNMHENTDGENTRMMFGVGSGDIAGAIGGGAPTA